MQKLSIVLSAFVAVACSYSSSAGLVEVNANAGPWDPSVSGNGNYGEDDQTDPVSVPITGGVLVSISGATGVAQAGNAQDWPQVGPNGYIPGSSKVSWAGEKGSSGTYFPGSYVSNPGSSYLLALMGAWANGDGLVIGTPFIIGTGSLDLTAPVGATQLLLGVNDDIYSDNVGSFQVNVSAVPEPSTYLAGVLLLLPFGVQAFRRVRD